ncbi:MAG: hypothetical protein IIA83_07135 [Thaumarchaeota archaeon]|nr:hypothetical protein [Nitrososphaerota archaeon]
MSKNEKFYEQFECDLRHQLKIIAAQESIKYIKKNMNNALCFSHDPVVLFDYVLPKINNDGLILEFGVRKGKTIKEIARMLLRNSSKINISIFTIFFHFSSRRNSDYFIS